MANKEPNVQTGASFTKACIEVFPFDEASITSAVIEPAELDEPMLITFTYVLEPKHLAMIAEHMGD